MNKKPLQKRVMISLPVDLVDKLSTIKNKSGLIQQLLTDHFNDQLPPAPETKNYVL